MNFLNIAIILIVVSVALVALIRKNLEQRIVSRKLRSIFINEAYDLIAKPEFPEAHAKMLVGMSAMPGGWITRVMVMLMIRNLFWSSSKVKKHDGPKIEQVPKSLQKKFVLAMLAFSLSDSYRCVIFGRIYRTTNNWLTDAIEEPKGDVYAHATSNVIGQVVEMQSRKAILQKELQAA